jgi:magnesium-transporting ATPase (P-type)
MVALCHTVNVDENNPIEKFQASSPDEFSFLKFCEKYQIL